MIYRKNVPNWERALRMALAAGLVALAILGPWNQQWIVTAGLISSAVFVALTAFFGWCPACAMIGRKINEAEITKS